MHEENFFPAIDQALVSPKQAGTSPHFQVAQRSFLRTANTFLSPSKA